MQGVESVYFSNSLGRTFSTPCYGVSGVCRAGEGFGLRYWKAVWHVEHVPSGCWAPWRRTSLTYRTLPSLQR